MSFKFVKLKLWQIAMEYDEYIYQIFKSFPKSEMYNLSSQITKASNSIALNISEGSIKQCNAEFTSFLRYSLRSLAEVVTYLYNVKRRDYINEEIFETKYQESYKLMNMILAFKSKINSTQLN